MRFYGNRLHVYVQKYLSCKLIITGIYTKTCSCTKMTLHKFVINYSHLYLSYSYEGRAMGFLHWNQLTLFYKPQKNNFCRFKLKFASSNVLVKLIFQHFHNCFNVKNIYHFKNAPFTNSRASCILCRTTSKFKIEIRISYQNLFVKINTFSMRQRKNDKNEKNRITITIYRILCNILYVEYYRNNEWPRIV